MTNTNITKKCPNSDPNFDKILSKLGMNTTSKNYPETRKKIYYFICIVVRLILYSLVIFYKDKVWLHYSLFFISLFAIYNLYTSISNNKSNNQWWSKKFQLIISILLAISSLIIIIQNKLNTTFKLNTVILPLLLFISLFGGILQSLFVKFC